MRRLRRAPVRPVVRSTKPAAELDFKAPVRGQENPQSVFLQLFHTLQFEGEKVRSANPDFLDRSITHLAPGYNFSKQFGVPGRERGRKARPGKVCEDRVQSGGTVASPPRELFSEFLPQCLKMPGHAGANAIVRHRL